MNQSISRQLCPTKCLKFGLQYGSNLASSATVQADVLYCFAVNPFSLSAVHSYLLAAAFCITAKHKGGAGR